MILGDPLLGREHPGLQRRRGSTLKTRSPLFCSASVSEEASTRTTATPGRAAFQRERSAQQERRRMRLGEKPAHPRAVVVLTAHRDERDWHCQGRRPPVAASSQPRGGGSGLRGAALPGAGDALQGRLTGPGHHTAVARGDHDDGARGFRRASLSCGRKSKSPWYPWRRRRREDQKVTPAALTGHPASRDPPPVLLSGLYPPEAPGVEPTAPKPTSCLETKGTGSLPLLLGALRQKVLADFIY